MGHTIMSAFDLLPLTEKVADILARYVLSGPTQEALDPEHTRHIYLLTKKDKPTDTRRVVREFGAGDDIWYAEGVPFFARHKIPYYAEAVKRAVTGAARPPVTE